MTHADFKQQTLYFWDKQLSSHDEGNPTDKAYSYDKLILSPEPWLSDSVAKRDVRGYQRHLLTDDHDPET